MELAKLFSQGQFFSAVQKRGVKATRADSSRVQKGFQSLQKLLRQNSSCVYGIHTGFGGLQGQNIGPQDYETHQRRLVASHACGVGPALEPQEVRAMMLLRASELARGHSGVSPSAFGTYLDVLNSARLPRVPSLGSVGACGDLIPLAHVAMEVLRRVRRLGPRDGLALINGTQACLGVSLLAWNRAMALAKSAHQICALTLFAMQGKTEAWDERLVGLKKHVDGLEAGRDLRYWLGRYSQSGLPQDPYSLRAAPQLFGASRHLLKSAGKLLADEAGSVTDNPALIFEATPVALHGANFHGIAVGVAADQAAWALHLIALASERRMDHLLSGRRGLAAMLAAEPRSSGLMMLQVAQGALVAASRQLSQPASLDSIPASASQEDVVPMAMGAALKLNTVVQKASYVLAAEALAAARAVSQSGRRAALERETRLAPFWGRVAQAAGRALDRADEGFSSALENIAARLQEGIE